MIGAVRSYFTPLRRDERGVTVVEFAILIVPFLTLLLGGLDLAHNVYIRGVAKGALDDVSRLAAVEDPQFMAGGGTLDQRVEAAIKHKVGPVAPNAEFTITQQSYFDFSAVGQPERITRDNNNNGKYNAIDNDCFEDFNDNGIYDTEGGKEGFGGANDIVFYTVRVKMPRLFPIFEFISLSPDLDFTIGTAVRNQPFDIQATPKTICGAGV